MSNVMRWRAGSLPCYNWCVYLSEGGEMAKEKEDGEKDERKMVERKMERKTERKERKMEKEGELISSTGQQ
jgi:hypothetical protein